MRRTFIGAAVTFALGGTIPGRAAVVPRDAPVGAGDGAILAAMLDVEHAALAACRNAAGSGLLGPLAHDAVARFAADHRAHRDLIAATIRTLGGDPRHGRSPARPLPLASEADALDLVARHERLAVESCLRMVPALADRRLATVAARIACDEAMHWTLVNAALARPVPRAALSFGA